jgi:hypothetical protein
MQTAYDEDFTSVEGCEIFNKTLKMIIHFVCAFCQNLNEYPLGIIRNIKLSIDLENSIAKSIFAGYACIKS